MERVTCNAELACMIWDMGCLMPDATPKMQDAVSNRQYVVFLFNGFEETYSWNDRELGESVRFSHRVIPHRLFIFETMF